MPSSSCDWPAETSFNVTPHPTADWIARQITEAFPWNEAPRYLIRDRDQVYGAAVRHRLRAMGIRDKPIAPGSPWQNGFAERLIGSIALGEAHLRGILQAYARYYLRTHRSLDKDAQPRARFSAPDASRHRRSSADYITTTCESEFSVHTGTAVERVVRAANRYRPFYTQWHPFVRSCPRPPSHEYRTAACLRHARTLLREWLGHNK
jgi:hypothetical protein